MKITPPAYADKFLNQCVTAFEKRDILLWAMQNVIDSDECVLESFAAFVSTEGDAPVFSDEMARAYNESLLEQMEKYGYAEFLAEEERINAAC